MIRHPTPVKNRHLVREIDRGRVRELLRAAGLVAILLLPLLAYVWNHMEWIRGGYDRDRLERERVEQSELGRRLRIEKAALESLARIEVEAREHLEMVPAEEATVRLDDPAPAPMADAGRVAGARKEAVR